MFTNLEQDNLAVDTPRWHQHFPKTHHKQYPTHCSCRPPLSLHMQHYLLPVAADQLCKGLCVKIRQLCQCSLPPSSTPLPWQTYYLYLHTPHQHQQSGNSCVTGLVYCSTLTADWNLKYTGHHPRILAHCQHQNRHCCMLGQLLFTE